MSQHQIVIFANSLKHGQHCVAGKLLGSSQWVRPVSNENGGELSHAQASIINPYGRFNVKPLQRVIIGLQRHVPLLNQPENYLVDSSVWRQNYSIAKSEVSKYLDNPTSLWGEGGRISYDLIKSQRMKIDQSLYLIQTDKLRLYKNENDKRRANFIYENINYDFPVTDPNFDRLLENSSNLSGILCISLGEKFEGKCYKLVATLI